MINLIVLAGLIGCFLLCIILGACEAFTMYVLSKFAERYQAPTYSGLVRKALGRKLSASKNHGPLTIESAGLAACMRRNCNCYSSQPSNPGGFKCVALPICVGVQVCQ